MTKRIATRPDAKQTKTVTSPWRWWRNIQIWVWTAVAVLAIFDALIANNQALNGQELTELEVERTNLSVEIDSLSRQVAESGSLQSIRQRATSQLGLEPVADNVWYLAWPTPVKGER